MGLEMIDRHQRLAEHQRHGLGRGETDQNSPDQPRSAGRRHRIEVARCRAGLAQGLRHDTVDDLDMRARGDLRHHAAIGGVVLDLRAHDIGQDGAPAVRSDPDHRRRRLVAGGLDAEDQHGPHGLPSPAGRRDFLSADPSL